MNSSSFLTENERPALASIVLVGGWVEGLYIASNLVGDADIEGNKLVERIVDQKLSFDIVMQLLEDNKDNIDVAEILADIGDLKATFDKIIITTTSKHPSTFFIRCSSLLNTVLKLGCYTTLSRYKNANFSVKVFFVKNSTVSEIFFLLL